MNDSAATLPPPQRAIRAVTVFCASSDACGKEFARAAADLGHAIARQGWRLVYGGNSVGLMRIVADAARQEGGRVIGVTPKFFVDKGLGDDRCEKLIVSNNMRDRKNHLEEQGDAFIALPGGLGTLDEIFDCYVARSLGLHDKPLVLLNLAGFYDPFLAMIDHGIEHQFIKPRLRQIPHMAQSVAGAIEYLKSANA